ncbi:MAG: hypothetical protein A2487_14380, partial [Candidatus Raymondbacteria bacterium RifOxyC12_full_50_8]
DPKIILRDISRDLNAVLEQQNTILFLDEIQAAGELLAKLRWFAEEMQGLAVIAAGSLLEFTLADHSFSMPVGRIGFLHIEPLGFIEFLTAHKQDLLIHDLLSWRPGREFSPNLHEQALKWFDRFLTVGGMPAIVERDVSGTDEAVCREQQLDLAATYRSDFPKYAKRIEPAVLDSVLRSAALSLGRKFVYAKVEDGVKQHVVKKAIGLLSAARVCHLVRYSAANGLPLGGETKDTFRKVILNDIGLLHALLRFPAHAGLPRWDLVAPQVRGQMAEQAVGQLLRLLGPASGDGPELYYWQREGGRPGEIDYIIQICGRIIPIELKSGETGTMKSLHQFMHDKKLSLAVRFDRNPPALIDLSTKTTQGQEVKYRLYNLPHYMAERLETIVGQGI